MTVLVPIPFLLGPDYAGKGVDGDGSLKYSIISPDNTTITALTSAGLNELGGNGSSGAYPLVIAADLDWGAFVWVWLYDGEDLIASAPIDLSTPASISAIPTTGVGPLVRTITVHDADGNPIIGADVGMSGGFTATTDTDGTVAFRHVSGTFTIDAAADNFLGATTGPIPMAATGTTVLVMNSLGIVPSSDPAQSTGYCTTRDGQGNAVGGITLTFALLDPYPDADVTIDSWDRRNFKSTSDADTALLQVPFKRGGLYHGKNDGEWVEFTVPDEDSFALPEILSTFGA